MNRRLSFSEASAESHAVDGGDMVTNNAVVKAAATPEQRADYLEAGIETLAGLDEAVRILTLRSAVCEDREERGRCRAHATELAQRRARVCAELVGFLSDTFRFRAPTDRSLGKLRQASRNLFALTPEASSETVLEAADSLCSEWGATAVRGRDAGPGPAGSGPAPMAPQVMR